MKKVGFIFPGQGSQRVGMGQSFIDSNSNNQQLFQQADDLLGFSLSEIMLEGPEEKLTKTSYAQPALLLVSTLIYRELLDAGIRPTVLAGHSLGEYSALVAAGVLSFEEALILVHQRGKLMEEAYPDGDGGMAAVLGLDQATIESKLSTLSELVDIANLNCPGQIVISGEKSGIEQAINSLKEAGAKRVIPLNVSGPFHSRLMKPAAERFEQILENLEFSEASTAIYSNVTAEKTTNAAQLKELLVKQLYSPVKFHEIIEQLLNDDLDALVEVGSGKVLTGLVKKVSRRATVFSVQDDSSLQTFIDWYQGGE
ncbi:ACP S-malonyltransferase [Amphibacillus sp. MSJ-3]|uniref:ACP S-malonyltransferase n=1 Tax=Amphibacillus sp. MSJ-3 TaxID=2841505 RepID=UPI001C0F1245|nr:ACP S-malonyltransferase [Amphibacillus sp. MSJ-3]MBU5594594.1 ACP S-malonyltransferase [Amphibacillus sp. MSJ-3]